MNAEHSEENGGTL